MQVFGPRLLCTVLVSAAICRVSVPGSVLGRRVTFHRDPALNMAGDDEQIYAPGTLVRLSASSSHCHVRHMASLLACPTPTRQIKIDAGEWGGGIKNG